MVSNKKYADSFPKIESIVQSRLINVNNICTKTTMRQTCINDQLVKIHITIKNITITSNHLNKSPGIQTSLTLSDTSDTTQHFILTYFFNV